MSAATASAPDAVEEEFWALMCEDEELLRAEFEAIVSAAWPDPPDPPPAPTPPTDPAGPVRPMVWPGFAEERTEYGCRGPEGYSWVRQRSPPLRTVSTP
jgi:hypothetical protein